MLVFQCPPSRAGSCGPCTPATCTPRMTSRSFSALHRGQGPAGDVLALLLYVALPMFQCPPSRAGSCGSTTRSSPPSWHRSFSALHRGQGPAGVEQVPPAGHHRGDVSVPSIAGRVLRVNININDLRIALALFQCPPSRAGSCGSRSQKLKYLQRLTPTIRRPQGIEQAFSWRRQEQPAGPFHKYQAQSVNIKELKACEDLHLTSRTYPTVRRSSTQSVYHAPNLSGALATGPDQIQHKG